MGEFGGRNEKWESVLIKTVSKESKQKSMKTFI